MLISLLKDNQYFIGDNFKKAILRIFLYLNCSRESSFWFVLGVIHLDGIIF